MNLISLKNYKPSRRCDGDFSKKKNYPSKWCNFYLNFKFIIYITNYQRHDMLRVVSKIS